MFLLIERKFDENLLAKQNSGSERALGDGICNLAAYNRYGEQSSQMKYRSNVISVTRHIDNHQTLKNINDGCNWMSSPIQYGKSFVRTHTPESRSRSNWNFFLRFFCNPSEGEFSQANLILFKKKNSHFYHFS